MSALEADAELDILYDDDEEAIAEADARAEADYAAGRFVSNGEVRAWLIRWRDTGETDMPDHWLK